DPLKPVTASMCDSSTITVNPSAPKSRCASATCSAEAWRPGASAMAPWPMRQGVLGMARMAGVPGGKLPSMTLSGTPAAMEMTHAPLLSAGPISRSTGATRCGFTATMTVSASRAASGLVAAWTPCSWATRTSLSWSASVTHTCPRGTSPARRMPLTSASPMAPTPIQAKVRSRGVLTRSCAGSPCAKPLHLPVFAVVEVVIVGHLGAPVRHIDAHIARGEEEQGVPEPVHAAVQRVCGAHDKVHQPPGDVLGQRLHRHDHGPPLLEAVNHGLNILKPGRLLHHDAETLLVTACPGQADQAGPAGIGFRAGLERRKLRLLSRGLFRLDPKKTEN